MSIYIVHALFSRVTNKVGSFVYRLIYVTLVQRSLFHWVNRVSDTTPLKGLNENSRHQ